MCTELTENKQEATDTARPQRPTVGVAALPRRRARGALLHALEAALTKDAAAQPRASQHAPPKPRDEHVRMPMED